MKILRLLRRESLQILLLALPFALAGAWWDKIPPVVTTHWNFAGQPDGWMPKTRGLFILPLLNVLTCGLIALTPKLDPRLRRNPSADNARQRRLRRIYRLAISGWVSVVSLALVAVAAGWRISLPLLAVDGTLVLLAIIGNFIGALEPSYLVGFRNPWTLADAATWRAMHRLGGRVLTFGSLVVLGINCFVPDTVQLALLLAFVIGLGLWSVGYSAWFYRRLRPAG